MNEKIYDGIVDEILFYGERSQDGRWIIPIAIDWDYTLTKCSSWETGEMVLNEHAFQIMKRWIKEYNVGFILDTMRHDEILEEPLRILNERGITLYGIRKNPQQEKDENSVPKVFAIMSIDDRNLGTPHSWEDGCIRPHVDWNEVDRIASPILEAISNGLKNKVSK